MQLVKHAGKNYESADRMNWKIFRRNIIRIVEEKELDAKKLYLQNRKFHFAIYSTCGMDRVCGVIESLWDKITICTAAGRAEWRKRMKAFDCVNKQEVEVTKEGLIDFMKKDRQIDMKFAEKRTDDMGYLTWDAENWTCVDGQNKFMRCYSLGGPCAEGFHQP